MINPAAPIALLQPRQQVARPIELSFVFPAYNEEGNIAETIARVHAEAVRLRLRHEILIVDDGSGDATCENAIAMAHGAPVRTLRLSHNFGKEHATMAGLERAKGAFARLFYRLLGMGSKIHIPPDARDFRLMDRRVVDALCTLPERDRFMKGLYGWVGFRSITIPIELEPRQNGTSKFGFLRRTQLALTGLTSFTNWPLHMWTGIGMFIAALSILYGVWITLRTLFFGVDVQGRSTLVFAVCLLGGVQLISIGVLGEYLSRVFMDVKGRPGFIIAKETAGDAVSGS